jgi:hypothetical protein
MDQQPHPEVDHVIEASAQFAKVTYIGTYKRLRA